MFSTLVSVSMNSNKVNTTLCYAVEDYVSLSLRIYHGILINIISHPSQQFASFFPLEQFHFKIFNSRT